MNFFCGVPDSLLKDFCAYITANVPASAHVITANEGSAIAMAAGHYLATKQYACVYMQNSGLGNMVNPLMSLAHPDVYRSEPGCWDSALPSHFPHRPCSLPTSSPVVIQRAHAYYDGLAR